MPTEINRACLKASPSWTWAHSWLALGSKSVKFAQMPNNCDRTLHVAGTALEHQVHSERFSWRWPEKEFMDVVAAVTPTWDMWAQQHPQPSLTSPFGQCPALPGTVRGSPPLPKGYSTQLTLRLMYH